MERNPTQLAQHKMGGLQLSVFVRKGLQQKVQGLQILDVACGVGNVLTNKGAICAMLRMQGKTIAFVNAHFAAHQGKVKDRNQDYQRVTESIVSRAPKRWLHKGYKVKLPKKVSPLVVTTKRSNPLESLLSKQPLLKELLKKVVCGHVAHYNVGV